MTSHKAIALFICLFAISFAYAVGVKDTSEAPIPAVTETKPGFTDQIVEAVWDGPCVESLAPGKDFKIIAPIDPLTADPDFSQARVEGVTVVKFRKGCVRMKVTKKK